MAQGLSIKIFSVIKWIRNSRFSIKASFSVLMTLSSSPGLFIARHTKLATGVPRS